MLKTALTIFLSLGLGGIFILILLSFGTAQWLRQNRKLIAPTLVMVVLGVLGVLVIYAVQIRSSPWP